MNHLNMSEKAAEAMAGSDISHQRRVFEILQLVKAAEQYVEEHNDEETPRSTDFDNPEYAPVIGKMHAAIPSSSGAAIPLPSLLKK